MRRTEEEEGKTVNDKCTRDEIAFSASFEVRHHLSNKSVPFSYPKFRNVTWTPQERLRSFYHHRKDEPQIRKR